MSGAGWIVLAAGAIVFSAWLQLWGWRGRRVNRHPVCRRCGYDLSGHAAPTACPECGADLQVRRSIRIGQRKRQPAIMLFGAVLAAGTVVAIGVTASRTNLNPYKPMWLLMRQAIGPNATAAGAMKELQRRMDQSLLSPAQTTRLADFALDRQMDTSSRWNSGWGTIIETGWTSNSLSEAQKMRYLTQSCDEGFALVHRPKVRQDGPISFFVQAPAFRTSAKDTSVRFVLVQKLLSIRLGEQEHEHHWNSISHASMFPKQKTFSGFGPRIIADAAPGIHVLRAKLRTGVRTVEDFARNPVRGLGEWPPTLVEWEHEVASTIEIVPQDAQIIELIDTADLQQRLQRCASVRDQRMTMNANMLAAVQAIIDFNSPPIDLAMRSWIEVEGERFPAGHGTVSAIKGEGVLILTVQGENARHFPSEATHADIVLEADAAVAEESIEVGQRIFGGTLRFNSVPIVAAPR